MLPSGMGLSVGRSSKEGQSQHAGHGHRNKLGSGQGCRAEGSGLPKTQLVTQVPQPLGPFPGRKKYAVFEMM